MARSSLQTTYSFGNVTGTLNGRDMVGFWEGDDTITVEEGADIGTGVVGADGSSIFSQAVNNSARITLRVQHRSPLHNLLHQQLARQRGGNLAGIPLTFRDGDSNEGGACDRAMIMQAPGVQQGTNASVRTWVLWTGNFQHRIPRA
jgi:hypothetical protein